MNFSDMNFKRKFSMNFCKTLKVPMSKMTFTSDFTNTERGDLYPIIYKESGAVEHVCPAKYSVNYGTVERLLCAFFPFATHKMKIKKVSGSVGFAFVGPEARCTVVIEDDGWNTSIVAAYEGEEKRVKIPRDIEGELALVVSARPGSFDVYISANGVLDYVTTVNVPSFEESNRESFYQSAKVHTLLSGDCVITGAETYVDCGIGQADIRPFRYENGDLYMENGRVFLTFSARMVIGSYQGILSWLPGTSDFKMEGAVFYDVGTGVTHGDVATAYVYHRGEGKWYMWQRSAGAGHVLAKTSFNHDIRYGINIVDVEALPHMTEENMCDEMLLGKKGDEDPDFMYDEERGKWLFAICRLAGNSKKYQYFFFESDYPDRDYVYVGRGPAGEETGGSIVKLDGKIYFACGNDFKKKSDYRVYEWGKFDTFTNLKCDYPDGGFRGWATILPVKYGRRTRYFWLTFDRTLMSKIHNWSYGNIYCFEAEGHFPV
ncbi:MAG: hypothetical protein IJY18_04085 [Clostridia bacterium]|nr:hypothetical protein [Clostridia bacterium]